MQEGIYDEFVAKLAEAFKKVKVGNPLCKDTQMGSQINERQLQKILGWVEEAKKEGAKVLAGGERAVVPGCEKGAFMQPTLLVDCEKSDECLPAGNLRPVACVIKFKNEAEVLQARQ